MRLIDADAFRAIMYQKCMVEDSEDQRWDSGCWIRYRLFEKALEEMPPAQPEQKTGRWQYVDYGGFGNWHCTACRKICICNGDFDFCPNCGASMEEDDGRPD